MRGSHESMCDALGLPLRDASVRLYDNGTILAQGTTALYGFSLPARVVLQPRVVAGLLAFAVVTSEAGRFRLPTAASDQLASALNRQLRAGMADQPFRLVALIPGQGTLAIRLQLAGPPGRPGAQPSGQGCWCLTAASRSRREAMRRAIRIALAGITGLAGLACGVAIVLALAVLVLPLPALPPPAPKPWVITVTVTEAFLARELNARQGDQASSIKDAQVSFQADGIVTVTGTVAPSGSGGGGRGGPPFPLPPQGRGLLGDGVPATIVLRPAVENDRLKTRVVSLQVGPLGVPGQLAGLLDGPLNAQLNNALGGWPYRLVEVSVRQRLLTMRARRARRRSPGCPTFAAGGRATSASVAVFPADRPRGSQPHADQRRRAVRRHAHAAVPRHSRAPSWDVRQWPASLRCRGAHGAPSGRAAGLPPGGILAGHAVGASGGVAAESGIGSRRSDAPR